MSVRTSGRTILVRGSTRIWILPHSHAGNGASGGHFLPRLRAATPIIACIRKRIARFGGVVKHAKQKPPQLRRFSAVFGYFPAAMTFPAASTTRRSVFAPAALLLKLTVHAPEVTS